MCRMMNWFTGEPWIEGTLVFKDMQVVRKMHAIIRTKLSGLDNHKVRANRRCVQIRESMVPGSSIASERFRRGVSIRNDRAMSLQIVH